MKLLQNVIWYVWRSLSCLLFRNSFLMAGSSALLLTQKNTQNLLKQCKERKEKKWKKKGKERGKKRKNKIKKNKRKTNKRNKKKSSMATSFPFSPGPSAPFYGVWMRANEVHGRKSVDKDVVPSHPGHQHSAECFSEHLFLLLLSAASSSLQSPSASVFSLFLQELHPPLPELPAFHSHSLRS